MQRKYDVHTCLLVLLGAALLGMSSVEAAEVQLDEYVDVADADTRCMHGVPLAPNGVTCCTPKDAYFRNLFIQNLLLTSTIIITNGAPIACCNSGGASCSTVQTGTACDAMVNNATALQNVEPGYYDALDRYEVLSSNVDIQDVFGNEILIPSAGGPSDLFGTAAVVSARGTFVVFGASNANSGQGIVYVYRRDAGDTWNLLQMIPAPVAESNFGGAIALSADASIMAVGASQLAPSGPNGTGAVYLYVQDQGTGLYNLVQTILDPNSDPADTFGVTLDLSATGEVLLVGNPTFNASQGAAYSYIRAVSCSNCLGHSNTLGTWTFQQQILEATPGDNSFASSVKLSADGNFAAIGALAEGVNGSGAVYIFQETAGVWNAVFTLNPTDALGPYAFGTSVSISGDADYVIVGAPGQGTSGLVYIFYRSDAVWNQQAILQSQVPGAPFLATGTAVAVSNNGTKVAFSSGNGASLLGTVDVYARFDTNWRYIQTLSANQFQVPDFFGGVLGISYDGSFLAVGAPTTDGDTGAGYIFSPRCAFVPADLTVSGSVCVNGTMSINGNLFITGTLFYGGAAPTPQVITPCGVCSSDQFLKEHIEPLDGAVALAALNKLRPVCFRWKRPDLHTELGTTPMSFISQEVQKSFPHWVSSREPRTGEKELFKEGEDEQMLAIQPDIFALLVASIQKLQRDYDALCREAQQLKEEYHVSEK